MDADSYLTLAWQLPRSSASCPGVMPLWSVSSQDIDVVENTDCARYHGAPLQAFIPVC